MEWPRNTKIPLPVIYPRKMKMYVTQKNDTQIRSSKSHQKVETAQMSIN